MMHNFTSVSGLFLNSVVPHKVLDGKLFVFSGTIAATLTLLLVFLPKYLTGFSDEDHQLQIDVDKNHFLDVQVTA